MAEIHLTLFEKIRRRVTERQAELDQARLVLGKHDVFQILEEIEAEELARMGEPHGG